MKRALKPALLGVIALVFGYAAFKYSLYLAAVRMYHADECRNAFLARILATNQAGPYSPGVSLLLVPLIWLARDAAQSVDILDSARLMSLVIFWLNLLLLALATGEKLLSRRGLIVLVGAATLAPLWDFGFEIRSDNLLLTGLLVTWCAVRCGPPGMGAYLFVGAVAAAMQFTSCYALVYTMPLTIALLSILPSREVSRSKLMVAWAGGAGGMFLTICICYGVTGVWGAFVAGLPSMWRLSTDIPNEGAWKIPVRLVGQMPLLLALLPAGLIAAVVDLRRHRKDAPLWNGNLPEALLFLLALGVLILYPVPQHLLEVVAFAYLLCYRYAATVMGDIWAFPLVRPLIVTMIVFAHGVPFFISTRRHFSWSNNRQVSVMRLAEQLTDPSSDPVYDGMGMVPTRRSVRSKWFLQSLNLRDTKQSVETLAERPPVVFIRSYRTDQLPSEEVEFIREHYVALADDFWVPGKLLPAKGGTFQIIHPGRYLVTTKEASCILGTVELNSMGLVIPPVRTNCVGKLDGVPLTGKPVELTVGTHQVETASDCQPAVVWLGPRLNRLSPISDGDHLRLYLNWY